MANTFFQFKQFTVHQEHCAMKVCTDACLFGAWITENYAYKQAAGIMDLPNKLKTSNGKFKQGNYIAGRTGQKGSVNHSLKVLDIGTGSGLLSLMIAQKWPGIIIDAVEIDGPAAGQADQNFKNSPWKERLNLITADIRGLLLPEKYDLIISNPPFFENDLKSVDNKRNLALHSEALSFMELLQVIKEHLTDDGKFAVLLPYHRAEDFEKMAASYSFYMEKRTLVKQTPGHSPFRSMLLFSLQVFNNVITAEIIIKNELNDYTQPFTDLLKEYYLLL